MVMQRPRFRQAWPNSINANSKYRIDSLPNFLMVENLLPEAYPKDITIIYDEVSDPMVDVTFRFYPYFLYSYKPY